MICNKIQKLKFGGLVLGLALQGCNVNSDFDQKMKSASNINPDVLQSVENIESIQNSYNTIQLPYIPNEVFKTKEGHEVKFRLEGQNLVTEIKHNLPEGFSCNQTLPVIFEKDQNPTEFLKNLNTQNSKYLIHPTPSSNPKTLFLGNRGLKGGGGDAYTGYDSEGSPSSTWDTTLKDGNWPVQVYKSGNVWRAHVKYPDYKWSSNFCNSVYLTFRFKHSGITTMSINDMRAAYWVINCSYIEDKVTSVNYAEILSTSSEIQQAKEARRLLIENRKKQIELDKIINAKEAIEKEKIKVQNEIEKMRVKQIEMKAMQEKERIKQEEFQAAIETKQSLIDQMDDMDAVLNAEEDIKNLNKQIEDSKKSVNDKLTEMSDYTTKLDELEEKIVDTHDKLNKITEEEKTLDNEIKANVAKYLSIQSSLEAAFKGHQEEVKKYNEDNASEGYSLGWLKAICSLEKAWWLGCQIM
jgi:hypothetical protein